MKPNLALPCLCLVTDRKRVVSGDIIGVVAQAVDGGVGMVQLREKDCPAAELLTLARELRAVTHGKALLIINDRVDIAILSGADGTQLGENALDVDSARRLAGDGMLIGRSVHSVEGAVEAETSGADFLILGTLFETSTHPGAQTGGLDIVRNVNERVSVPILGIGGVSESNIADAIGAGASGAAVISAISMSADPKEAASRLSESMTRAYRQTAEQI